MSKDISKEISSFVVFIFFSKVPSCVICLSLSELYVSNPMLLKLNIKLPPLLPISKVLGLLFSAPLYSNFSFFFIYHRDGS